MILPLAERALLELSWRNYDTPVHGHTAGVVVQFRPMVHIHNQSNDSVRTVEHLFENTGITINELSDRSGLPLKRLEAIVTGRWTPSPEERRRIAAAFGVSVEEVSWGHTMNPRNIRYHRFGLPEDFQRKDG